MVCERRSVTKMVCERSVKESVCEKDGVCVCVRRCVRRFCVTKMVCDKVV